MTTSPVVSITDELIAELESAASDSKLNIYRPFGWAHSVRCGNHMQTDFDFLSLASPETILALLAERADLKRQLAAASVDAERYWWLREKHDEVEGDVWVSAWNSEELCWESLDASCRPEYDGYFDLDAAVDAARSSTTESTTRNEK